MVESGMSFQHMKRVWMSLGNDLGTLRGECENIVVSENTVAPRHKASLGLELLRGPTSDVAAVAAQVVSSLREELEDPPERFCDAVTYAMMDDPVVIETGHVFDRTSVFDEHGKFKFDKCLFNRWEIASSAYPVVFLKKELIEHKQQRFDAVIAATRQVPAGPARDELLSVAEALLACLGSGLYIHQTAAYWELRLESVDGENAADVLRTLAVKESVGELGSDVPVRALFDRVSATLMQAGAILRGEVDEILFMAMPTEDLLKQLESVILEGDVENTRLRAKALVQKQVENGEIVLISAVRMSHEAVVRALIEAGADLDKAEDDGRTPLYFAVQEGHEAVVWALIEAGADVNMATDDGSTPLFIAAQEGHEVVVLALIERVADINKAEDDGRTPLYIGAQNGHKAVVRALMQADADVNKARDGGATPLSASSQPVSNVARGNHAAIVQRLWDAGAV